jgi:hypothetical protein
MITKPPSVFAVRWLEHPQDFYRVFEHSTDAEKYALVHDHETLHKMNVCQKELRSQSKTDEVGVYQSSRRPNEEKELAGGCLASITPVEIQAARGRYYLVGRNDDPQASQSDSLIDLSRNVLNGLPGPCALAAKK